MVTGSLRKLFVNDIELNWCFLLFHFLSVLRQEVQAMIPSCDMPQSGDFDELLALQQVVLISLRSKTQSLVKYDLQDDYTKDDLTSFLRNLADSLSLLRAVDRSLALDLWEQAFSSAMSCYIFNFVKTNAEAFEDSRPGGKTEALVQSLEREAERLGSFFTGFVRAKAADLILIRAKLLAQYLRATDVDAAIGFLKAMITSLCVKSGIMLVLYVHLVCSDEHEEILFQKLLGVP